MPIGTAALEVLGYFKHVRPEDRERLRAEIAASDYPLSVSVRRDYRADAECLDEQGILDFLGEVAPYLRHRECPSKSSINPRDDIVKDVRQLGDHVVMSGVTYNILADTTNTRVVQLTVGP